MANTVGNHKLSRRDSMTVGITLFSMFFGAGNLILAPMVGFRALGNTPIAMVGFLLSAVGLPIVALASMAKVGSLNDLTSRISPRFSRIFGCAVYLAIGPFLALPRTASTAFEMAAPMLDESHMVLYRALFSIVFFGVALSLAMKPTKMNKVMGKVSGPSLLVLIVILVGAVLINHPDYTLGAASCGYESVPFMSGFIKGYQTMDVLASLAFGIIISLNVKSMGLEEPSDVASQVGRSGIIAGVLLLLIYSGFAYLGVACNNLCDMENGAWVISKAAEYEFGVVGIVLVTAIFLIACLNVCTGLICSISEYFVTTYPDRLSYKTLAITFTVVSALISNVGLSSIINYSAPLLSALYPVALCLVLMGLMQKNATDHKQVWQIVIFVCTVISVVVAVRDGFIPGQALITDSLPFADYDMAWIVPSALAGVIGMVIEKIKVKRA